MSLLTQVIGLGKQKGWETDSETLPDFIRVYYFIPRPDRPDKEYSVTIKLNKHDHLLSVVLATDISVYDWEGLKDELILILEPHIDLLYSSIVYNFGIALQDPTDDLKRLENFVDTALVCAEQLHQAINLATQAVHDYAASLKEKK